MGKIYARTGLASQVIIGDVGASGSEGIVFGLAQDTNLYRSAADILKTDDNFQALSVRLGAIGDATLTRGVYVGYQSVHAYFMFTATGHIVSALGSANQVSMGGITGGGISFGNANDTNLYRAAANRLQTDDLLYLSLGSNRYLTLGVNVSGASSPDTYAGMWYDAATERLAKPHRH